MAVGGEAVSGTLIGMTEVRSPCKGVDHSDGEREGVRVSDGRQNRRDVLDLVDVSHG